MSIEYWLYKKSIFKIYLAFVVICFAGNLHPHASALNTAEEIGPANAGEGTYFQKLKIILLFIQKLVFFLYKKLYSFYTKTCKVSPSKLQLQIRLT